MFVRPGCHAGHLSDMSCWPGINVKNEGISKLPCSNIRQVSEENMSLRLTKLKGDEFADAPIPSNPRVRAPVQRARQTAQKLNQQTLSISISPAHFPSALIHVHDGNSSEVCNRITVHRMRALERKYKDGSRKTSRQYMEERSRGNIESYIRCKRELD